MGVDGTPKRGDHHATNIRKTNSIEIWLSAPKLKKQIAFLYFLQFRTIALGTAVGPLKNIANIVINKPKSNIVHRKRKANNNDTLANIQVPKYTYNALPFDAKRQQSNAQNKENDFQIEKDDDDISIDDTTQCSLENSRELLIEEYSSSEEQSPGKCIHSNTKHLLSLNESVFLNVNTQLAAADSTQPDQNLVDLSQRADGGQQNNISPHQHNDPQHLNAALDKSQSNRIADNVDANVQSVSSSTDPALNTNNTNHIPATSLAIYQNPFIRPGNPFEYLYNVNVENISARINLARDVDTLYDQLEIELGLRFQCNGQIHITINGQGPKKILRLTENQWSSVFHILNVIRQFVSRIDAIDSVDPPKESIFHRALYYLFKTTSTFTNVCIEYDDQDLHVVRILHKPYIRQTEDLTECVDRFALRNMHNFAQNI